MSAHETKMELAIEIFNTIGDVTVYMTDDELGVRFRKILNLLGTVSEREHRAVVNERNTYKSKYESLQSRMQRRQDEEDGPGWGRTVVE